MLYIFYIFLFVLGSIFGSFSSVIISRLRNGEGGIITGRSHCPKCNKILESIDLIPIISYMINNGKCRKCKKKISLLYPFLEIIMGLGFLFVGMFLIDLELLMLFDLSEIIKLFFLLTIMFFSLIFIIYDIKYLEIPDSILAILISFTTITLIYSTITGINIIPIYEINSLLTNGQELFGIILAITIIGGLYTIIFAELSEVLDIVILLVLISLLFVFFHYHGINLSMVNYSIPILSGAIGALGIFIFFFSQIIISGGKWMGGGDLRIAIFMGLLLGINYSIFGVFIAYLSGSIVGIILIGIKKIRRSKNKLIKKSLWNIYTIGLSDIEKIKLKTKIFFKTLFVKTDKKGLENQIPFGPFLGIGVFVVLFFHGILDGIFEKLF